MDSVIQRFPVSHREAASGFGAARPKSWRRRVDARSLSDLDVRLLRK